jgi:hypothetical protein
MDLTIILLYTIELHKEIVIKELYERGYDDRIIDEWIDYI